MLYYIKITKAGRIEHAVYLFLLLSPYSEAIMDAPVVSRAKWRHYADRVGMTASFLCAIHCAALPLVLAFLPLLGLSFLADHRFERIFVMFACVLALASLIGGYRRHRQPMALSLAIPGLLLLLYGVTFAEEHSIVFHSILVTCGGLLVASSHFVNLRTDRHAAHVHGPDCVHP